MSKLTHLARWRAERSQNACDWSPVDALRMLLEDVEAARIRPTKLVVHFVEESCKEAGCQKPHHGWVAAGINYPEHIAMLNAAVHHLLEEWAG